MASEDSPTDYWAAHVNGNFPESHDELAGRLRVSAAERVLCDELINQMWLSRLANRVGGFDFDSGYRLIISDKRLMLSVYGGTSSWLVRSIPIRLVTGFYRNEGTVGFRFTIKTTPDGPGSLSFDASRGTASVIEAAVREACPGIGLVEPSVMLSTSLHTAPFLFPNPIRALFWRYGISGGKVYSRSVFGFVVEHSLDVGSVVDVIPEGGPFRGDVVFQNQVSPVVRWKNVLGPQSKGDQAERLVKALQAAAKVQVTADRQERQCPYCAELVLVQARFCKHCGRQL